MKPSQTQAPAASRGMPSVNQKKAGKGALVAGVLIAVFILGVSAVGWYTINRLKSKSPPEQPTEEAPPPSKSKKFDDPDSVPRPAIGAPPAPSEVKVPAIDGTAGSTAPIAIRGKGADATGSPRLDGNSAGEVRTIQPRQEPSGPSPYDSGFIVSGGVQPGTAAKAAPGGIPVASPGSSIANMIGGGGARSDEGKGALQGVLSSTVTPTVKAGRLSNLSLVASEGTTAECVLRTKIVANQPGLVICRLATPIYSADGKVVLADRGSKVTGEQSGQMKQGQSRIFVLWRRIETPYGVVIKIDAPAADQLGGAGIDGDIDNKWPERIGASLMLSIISDAIAYQTAKDSSGSATGGIAYQGVRQSGKSIAEKVLDSTINIPPSLTRNQGDKILIMIPRDLDFSSVYDIQTK